MPHVFTLADGTYKVIHDKTDIMDVVRDKCGTEIQKYLFYYIRSLEEDNMYQRETIEELEKNLEQIYHESVN